MLKYLFILFLFGCSPTRHWEKVATDTNVTPKKKRILAPTAAALYPSQTKYLPGETIVRIDTTVDIDQIIMMGNVIDSLLSLPDSVRTIILERFRPLKVYRTVTRVDSVIVPNTAREYGLIHDLEVCETTNAALQTTNDGYLVRNAELNKGRNYWLKWFVAACIALAGSLYLNFKR